MFPDKGRFVKKSRITNPFIPGCSGFVLQIPLNLQHSSVKNKRKCVETCWSKEKVQSSFISAERKKNPNNNEETLGPQSPSGKSQLQCYAVFYSRSQSERTHS